MSRVTGASARTRPAASPTSPFRGRAAPFPRPLGMRNDPCLEFRAASQPRHPSPKLTIGSPAPNQFCVQTTGYWRRPHSRSFRLLAMGRKAGPAPKVVGSECGTAPFRDSGQRARATIRQQADMIAALDAGSLPGDDDRAAVGLGRPLSALADYCSPAPRRYSRYGVSTSSIHFMNARTRRDRLLRCATTRDTASARRRKSGMISTSAPLSKYRPIPKSGA